MSGKDNCPHVQKAIDQDSVWYTTTRGSTECPPKCLNITHPLRYYEFTQDEIKVLEECDRESFYHRCLPFSTLLAGLTVTAIKYGFLKRNPHFGAIPKVLTAALVGHLYGRVSYIPTCDQKIRELPENSSFAQIMRTHYKRRCSEEVKNNETTKKKC